MSEATHLMIVARPGDEVLYGGSLFATDSNITVVCLTGGQDVELRRSFRRSMNYWEIENFHIWNYTYHDPRSFPQGSKVIDEHLAYCQDELSPAYLRLHNMLQEADGFSSVITHNDSNDFHHAFDIAVHNLVKDLLTHRKSGGYSPCEDCEIFYVFDYHDTEKIPSDILQGKIIALDDYDRPDIWDVSNERLRYLTNEKIRPYSCV
tara:strand:- start:182 stop:799 length:618 start_codon:yes stop_codon:yes gene_type:complete